MHWRLSSGMRGWLVAASFLSVLLAVAVGAQSGNFELLTAGVAFAALLFVWLTVVGRRARGGRPAPPPPFSHMLVHDASFKWLMFLFLWLILGSMVLLAVTYILVLLLVPGLAAWLRGVDPTLLWLTDLFASFGLAMALGLRWQRRLLRLAVGAARLPWTGRGGNR